MDAPKQTPIAPRLVSPSVPAREWWNEARPRIGLWADLRTTPPGPVELQAAPDHRLMVHAGPPSPGSYRAQRVFYLRGDIDLFPAGVSEIWEAGGESTALILTLPPALLGSAAEGLDRDPSRVDLPLRCQFRDPHIEHIAWAMDAERRTGYLGGRLYAESLGLALAVHLVGGYAAPARLSRGLSQRELRRVTAYIEDHLGQDLSLSRLAGIAQVSVSHFKTLFKQSTGVPVHEYVVQRRVERARSLLLRGELPASQVALEVGFAHQSHMARWMRRILGVTPSALVRRSR
jgi:AraC family transcriptional regulator